MAEFQRMYDEEVRISGDDEEMQFNCDSARETWLGPAIDCAETLADCDKVEVALCCNGDESRNIYLRSRLARKRKELESEGK